MLYIKYGLYISKNDAVNIIKTLFFNFIFVFLFIYFNEINTKHLNNDSV